MQLETRPLSFFLFSVRFVFRLVSLGQGCFLRRRRRRRERVLGRRSAPLGRLRALRLGFSGGSVRLRRCGLCTVDWCEDYGRLQRTKRRESPYETAELSPEKKQTNEGKKNNKNKQRQLHHTHAEGRTAAGQTNNNKGGTVTGSFKGELE